MKLSIALVSGLVGCMPLATFAKGDPVLPAPAPAPAKVRVLFVGNSYTYTNDLPAMVRRVAAERGIVIETGLLGIPNAAIEDHIVTGSYASALRLDWDWVVLQQGPSSLDASREHLRHWSTIAATAARATGARVALMSVWPALENAHTWLRAEESYHIAAIASGSCVAPVAAAWRLARAADPAAALYQLDQLHPTIDGTYLAAVVITDALFEQPLRVAHNALDLAAREAMAEEAVRCHYAK